ncbi:MAG: hypothetical protein M1828_000751 [Chrysothrix sp. TS-e1954]|nr:MAG: hypothetical protein M1828_000751 [Chrysothrix sp. TS-e1954]
MAHRRGHRPKPPREGVTATPSIVNDPASMRASTTQLQGQPQDGTWNNNLAPSLKASVRPTRAATTQNPPSRATAAVKTHRNSTGTRGTASVTSNQLFNDPAPASTRKLPAPDFDNTRAVSKTASQKQPSRPTDRLGSGSRRNQTQQIQQTQGTGFANGTDVPQSLAPVPEGGPARGGWGDFESQRLPVQELTVQSPVQNEGSPADFNHWLATQSNPAVGQTPGGNQGPLLWNGMAQNQFDGPGGPPPWGGPPGHVGGGHHGQFRGLRRGRYAWSQHSEFGGDQLINDTGFGPDRRGGVPVGRRQIWPGQAMAMQSHLPQMVHVPTAQGVHTHPQQKVHQRVLQEARRHVAASGEPGTAFDNEAAIIQQWRTMGMLQDIEGTKLHRFRNKFR